MSVFVRFAPSPTGFVHIGNIRGALFNHLFARRNGGRFLLRLDDTDQERSTKEYADAIKEDMLWLGLKWDVLETQFSRMARYDEVLEQLKTVGHVYPCFETPEELSLKRKTQLNRGLPPVYDRSALKLSAKEVAEKIAAGQKPHWRFKLDHMETKWDDGIQGAKAFPTSSISDPVLVREDGVPLYTFCSVVDDIDMGITHILRGEDHVTNTSVQIQIWKAITDKPAPSFAHYPLLVSADGKEMSKRLGTLSIREMREKHHIEPMAIMSLLAKIGTSEPIAPYQTMEELAESFDLSKISRATPKFDMEELKHLNAKVIHQMDFTHAQEKLEARGHHNVTKEIWDSVHTNISSFDEIKDWLTIIEGPMVPVITDSTYLNEAAALLLSTPWDETIWTVWTKSVKEKTGRKGKDLFMPLRLALTGLDHGPEMQTLLPLIGYERTTKRLKGEAA